MVRLPRQCRSQSQPHPLYQTGLLDTHHLQIPEDTGRENWLAMALLVPREEEAGEFSPR